MSWPQGAGKCQPTPQTLALMDKKNAEVRNAVIEECAKIAENCFGGKAHTYASENADLYRAQDAACALIAAKIRALSVSRPDRGGAA